jgi:gluconokinase
MLTPDAVDAGLSRAIIVMGVSGTGKSTFGQALAAALHYPFAEGDECHPETNIEKMRAGIPLQDVDRWPWLHAVAVRMATLLVAQGQAIGTCSALKRAYRDYLRANIPGTVHFVCLEADRQVLSARLLHRADHFMPAELLESQLQAFERPCAEQDVLRLDAGAPTERLVEQAKSWLRDLATIDR